MPKNQSPNPTTETEILRQVFAALNRNDVSAMLQFFDPEIVRIEPESFPSAGTYRGHAEVGAHFSKALAGWAEGGCEPEKFVVAGDKIVVFIHVRVRMKNRTEWLEGRLADVFTFRDGRIIEMRTFAEIPEALEWVGVKSSNTETVLDVLEEYKKSVYAKDAEAFVAIYDNDVVVFDMWGKWKYQGIEAWRAMAKEWLGSLGKERVVVSFDDVQWREAQDMAFISAFAKYAAVGTDDLVIRSLQNRMTCVLQKKDGSWKIIHEHTSSPIDHNTLKAELRYGS